MLDSGNKQATIAWFVGILEGEGNFRKDPRSKHVRIMLCNTDTDIITACENLLKQHQIYYSKSEDIRINRKKVYTISISNNSVTIFDYTKILYKLVKDDMQCRINEFETAIESPQTTRALSINLDWLIGIFEAEGSFSLTMNNRDCVAFSIEIANTNDRILQKVANNLHSLGCTYYVQSKNLNDINKNWKNAQALNIYGMKRCFRFLEMTKDKWISGRNIKRTSLMLEFINSRFARSQKEPYSARELQIVQTMRDLNR